MTWRRNLYYAVLTPLLCCGGCSSPFGGEGALEDRPAPNEMKVVSVTAVTTKGYENARIASWDFTHPSQVKAWRFPRNQSTATPRGVVYSVTQNGAGFRLDHPGFRAKTVTAVRIEISAVRVRDTTESPAEFKEVLFRWARAVDMAASKRFPFNDIRQIALRVEDPETPNVWSGRVADKPDWDGTIRRVFVSAALPVETLQKGENFKVTVRRVEFLQASAASPG